MFGPCSVICGEGVQERTRVCNDPAPSLNGNPCDGEDTNSISCNRAECPGKTSFTFNKCQNTEDKYFFLIFMLKPNHFPFANKSMLGGEWFMPKVNFNMMNNM